MKIFKVKQKDLDYEVLVYDEDTTRLYYVTRYEDSKTVYKAWFEEDGSLGYKSTLYTYESDEDTKGFLSSEEYVSSEDFDTRRTKSIVENIKKAKIRKLKLDMIIEDENKLPGF